LLVAIESRKKEKSKREKEKPIPMGTIASTPWRKKKFVWSPLLVRKGEGKGGGEGRPSLRRGDTACRELSRRNMILWLHFVFYPNVTIAEDFSGGEGPSFYFTIGEGRREEFQRFRGMGETQWKELRTRRSKILTPSG